MDSERSARIPKLAREDLLAIDSMQSVPTIILNDELVLFTNQAFKHSLGFDSGDTYFYQDFDLILRDRSRRLEDIRRAIRGEVRPDETVSRGRTLLRKGDGSSAWFDYYGSVVQFYDSKYVMLQLIESTEHVEREERLERRVSMLESTVAYYRALQRAANLKDAYRIALDFALAMIPAAEFGAVLIRDGTTFVPFVSKGYDEYTLSKFVLPEDDLFINKSDGPDVDYTVKYDDLHLLREFYQVVRHDGAVVTIRSLLSTPVRHHGQLQAVLSVDSSTPNLFGEADLRVMELIRESLQATQERFA